MGKLSEFCCVCGNLGFPDKECPACHRQPTQKSMNFEFKDNTEFVQTINRFGIPVNYQGIIWNKDILIHDKPELERDFAFKKFANDLEKVSNLFESGLLTNKSAIIIAPAGFSKMTFAYSCMQRALDKKFSVAPFLDTIELKRLLYLASENPKYSLYRKINYDDYISSDICFVTVAKSQQHAWAYDIIQELLDLRARRGLGTFILSRFDLNEISQADKSNSFDALASVNTHDDYKYPAIIRYRKRFYDEGEKFRRGS